MIISKHTVMEALFKITEAKEMFGEVQTSVETRKANRQPQWLLIRP